MTEIKLTVTQFKELISKGYSLDMIFLLNVPNLIEELSLDLPRIDHIQSNMIRKGLISNGKITKDGEELLKFLSTKSNGTTKIIRSKVATSDFDKFWTAYPGTDTFDYKGKKFEGTRSLRVKKEDCKIKLTKILNEKEHTIQDIIDALDLEVFQKVESSYKTGQNKMSYMQNSLTWLNQRSFEPFIELVKKGIKPKYEVKEESSGGVEI